MPQKHAVQFLTGGKNLRWIKLPLQKRPAIELQGFSQMALRKVIILGVHRLRGAFQQRTKFQSVHPAKTGLQREPPILYGDAFTAN